MRLQSYLAGMLYYVFIRRKNQIWIRYILIPLFLLYSVQVYIFFAFAIPLYVCGLIRDKKWYFRFLIAFLPSAVTAGGSYYFLHLISSNYNIGKTEALLAALSAGNIGGMVKSLLGMVKEGIIGIWGLKNYITVSPLYPYSVLLALALLGVGCFMVARGRKNPERKEEYLVRFLLFFALIGVFLIRPQYRTFTENRYEASKNKQEWNALAKDWADVMKPDPAKSKWDNTVLMYTMEPKAILAVPAGMGENFVLSDGVFCEDAGYLLF